jgi:hypothetical protein
MRVPSREPLPSRVSLPSRRPQVLSPLQTEYTVGHCFNYGPALGGYAVLFEVLRAQHTLVRGNDVAYSRD